MPTYANSVWVVEDDPERLTAAHRQAGKGPVFRAGLDTVGLLNERDYLLHQLVGEPRQYGCPRGPDFGRGGAPGVDRGMFAGVGRLPLGITTSIGTAFFAAIRLSRMKPARPIVLQPESSSPPPCSR